MRRNNEKKIKKQSTGLYVQSGTPEKGHMGHMLSCLSKERHVVSAEVPFLTKK